MTYQETKLRGKLKHTATVKFADECKNGYPVFSLTIDTIEQRGNGRWVDYSFGTQPDVAHEVFPHLSQFMRLHLCDADGMPMYPFANGYYHLRNGFNRTKPDAPGFADLYRAHYRLSPEQYGRLSGAKSETHFAIILTQETDVLTCWKEEAREALKRLEELTGEKVPPPTTRTHTGLPSPEEMDEERQRLASGYYTEEAERAREAVKVEAVIAGWEKSLKKEQKQARRELEVKKQLIRLGGKHYVDRVIVYSHNKTVKLNWLSYGEPLTADQIAQIKSTVKLPKGYKYA